jgi:hypothetical protein
MRESWMTIISTWWVGASFVTISMLVAMVATTYVQRTKWFEGDDENVDIVNITYPMIGAIYGVVLAFTIVLSWQNFGEAEQYTSSEATHLSQLWRNSQAFPCEEQKKIEQALLRYTRAVVDPCCDSLSSKGELSPVVNGAYQHIWRCYRAYTPGTDKEQIFYEVGLEQLNNVGIQRRYRTSSATAEISSVVWVFLCVGGMFTIVIPMLVRTRHPKMQIGLIGVMTFIITFSLWIIAALQYPYSGDVRVESDPFESLIISFEGRREKDRRCPVDRFPVELLKCGEKVTAK